MNETQNACFKCENRFVLGSASEKIRNSEEAPPQIDDDFTDYSLQDICFNCCDGVVFGNRKLLSKYSLSLEQIFRDYPSIANDVKTPGIRKGIFLPNSYCEDVEVIIQTILTREFVPVKLNILQRIKRAAHILGMQIGEFANENGTVWVCVVERCNEESLSNIQITEITDNSTVEREEMVESSSGGTNKVGTKNGDTGSNDIRFNCADRHILGSRQQLSMYSPFLKQLFDEFPNIGGENILLSSNKGINVPTVRREHMNILFQAINEQDLIRFSRDLIPDINHAAMMLQMKIKFINSIDDSYTYLKVIPIDLDTIEEQIDLPNVIIENVKSDVDIKTDNISESQVSLSNQDRDDDCEIIEDSPSVHKYVGKARRSLPFTTKPKTIVKREKKESHYRRHKTENSSKVRCKCDKLFDNAVYYYKHRVDCQTYRKDAVICDICNNPFENEFSLKIHKSRIHFGAKVKNECCCGAQFSFKGILRNHQQTCHIFKATASHCAPCDLFFQSQSDIFVHNNSRAHLNRTKMLGR